jgi:hypothetical protein
MAHPSNPFQASQAWCDLDMWEQSDVVLAFAAKAAAAACATPLQQRSSSSSTGGAGAPGALPLGKAEQLCAQLFDVHVARYLTALKLDQQVRGSRGAITAACSHRLLGVEVPVFLVQSCAGWCA